MKTFQVDVINGDVKRGTDTLWIRAWKIEHVLEYLRQRHDVEVGSVVEMDDYSRDEGGIDAAVNENGLEVNTLCS
jgi:hypothetical protein